MISTATVHPTVKQIRRVARLCIGHGNENVRISFHRSGFVRVTIMEPGTTEGIRYVISPRGSIAEQEPIEMAR